MKPFVVLSLMLLGSFAFGFVLGDMNGFVDGLTALETLR